MSRWVDIPRAEAIRSHAMRRLFQRYGIAITNTEYAAIVERIAAGEFPSLGKALGGGTLHRVRMRDRDVYAVWSAEHGAVVTFLRQAPLELTCPTVCKAISA